MTVYGLMLACDNAKGLFIRRFRLSRSKRLRGLDYNDACSEPQGVESLCLTRPLKQYAVHSSVKRVCRRCGLRFCNWEGQRRDVMLEHQHYLYSVQIWAGGN